MKEFDNIKDMIYCEIDEISKHEKLDMTTLKVLGELVDILKDMGSIEMFEEGIQVQDEEYSFGRNSGYSQRRMPIYYEGNNSYRNGRGYNNRGYRGGYSRDGSKDHMIDQLEHLMNEAQDQKDRDSIQRLIEEMENK